MPRDIYGNSLPPVSESRDSDIFHNIITNKNYVFDNGEWNELPQEVPTPAPAIPTPTIADAGSVVVVGDDGKYELGEVSSDPGYSVETTLYVEATNPSGMDYVYDLGEYNALPEVGSVVTVLVNDDVRDLEVTEYGGHPQIVYNSGDYQYSDYSFDFDPEAGTATFRSRYLDSVEHVKAYSKTVTVSDDFKDAVESVTHGGGEIYELSDSVSTAVMTAFSTALGNVSLGNPYYGTSDLSSAFTAADYGAIEDYCTAIANGETAYFNLLGNIVMALPCGSGVDGYFVNAFVPKYTISLGGTSVYRIAFSISCSESDNSASLSLLVEQVYASVA